MLSSTSSCMGGVGRWGEGDARNFLEGGWEEDARELDVEGGLVVGGGCDGSWPRWAEGAREGARTMRRPPISSTPFTTTHNTVKYQCTITYENA